ncbi:glycosyltransferase family 4 protein [Botrimarina sp.]|uniref:glycosyltransferase family 4 protein n=1 Tax=Botrimarina sp. TaxID=2795802 RepID=UPI0032ED81B8
MNVAQVAPLTESVPPKTYGGIERIVSYLTEELVGRGHRVTLFAAGDSQTSARHVAVVEKSLRQWDQRPDAVMCHVMQLAEVVRLAQEFDVIHYHTDVLQYPLGRLMSVPMLTTLHGRLDVPGAAELFGVFREAPVVSISDSQRRPLRTANWLRTVYNGIPVERYGFRAEPGEYFAFLGRFTPEKGPEEAIRIAQRTGVPIRMAAKVDSVDTQYFADRIQPLLEDPLVEYIGEVGDKEKSDFLGGAKALLMPINWPEPFGLVMVEAMACGTPVIAFNRGSVPEVIRDGVTGFIVDSVDAAVDAVGRLDSIDRAECRRHCERNFSVARMVDGYEDAYRSLVSSGSIGAPGRRWAIPEVPALDAQPVAAAMSRIPPSTNGAAGAGLPGAPVSLRPAR